MIFSCCAAIKQYDQIMKAGYDRMILSAVELSSMDEMTFKKIRDQFASGKLSCHALNDFCGMEFKLCGPGFDVAAVRQYSRVLAARASQIGVRYLGIGAPKSRSIPSDYLYAQAQEDFKQSLAVICEEAANFEISVLLEAVCSAECNFINYTEEALELICSMPQTNLHLVFDTYHAFRMNEDDQPLRKAIKEIKLVHVAQSIDEARRYPQNGFVGEHQGYFEALLDCGYDGEISVEASLSETPDELEQTLKILKTLCASPIQG